MPKNKSKSERWIHLLSYKQVIIDEEEHEWFAPNGKIKVMLHEYYPPTPGKKFKLGVFDYDDGCMEYFTDDERKVRWIFDRIVHLVTKDELKNLGLI